MSGQRFQRFQFQDRNERLTSTVTFFKCQINVLNSSSNNDNNKPPKQQATTKRNKIKQTKEHNTLIVGLYLQHHKFSLYLQHNVNFKFKLYFLFRFLVASHVEFHAAFLLTLCDTIFEMHFAWEVLRVLSRGPALQFCFCHWNILNKNPV